MEDKILKANGLHSGTRFYDYYEGNYRIEYHEHPETKELVILRTWFVPDGDDDVAPDFEVLNVYPPIACELAKLNAPYMKDGKHFLLK